MRRNSLKVLVIISLLLFIIFNLVNNKDFTFTEDAIKSSIDKVLDLEVVYVNIENNSGVAKFNEENYLSLTLHTYPIPFFSFVDYNKARIFSGHSNSNMFCAYGETNRKGCDIWKDSYFLYGKDIIEVNTVTTGLESGITEEQLRSIVELLK